MDKIRLKLTFHYSMWFLAALSAILIIVYMMFRMTIYRDVNEELRAYLDQEKSMIQKGDWSVSHVYEESFGFFDIVISNDHKVIYKSGVSRRLLSEVKRHLPKRQNKVTFLNVNQSNDTVHLALISESLIKSGKMMGTLYVGKNLTREHEHLERMLTAFVIMAMLLFFVSMVIGDALAKKALIPIAENMERQRQFVANASHELKTPLAILQSSIEVVEAEEPLSDDARAIFRDMKEEMAYIQRLITELLELARYEHRQVILNKKPFPLSTHLSNVINRFCRASKNANLEIHLNDFGEDPILFADPDKVEQLMYILLDNAVKYADPTDETIDVDVTIRRYQKNHVNLSVRDHGIGIPPAKRERIFEPFYRVEQSRTKPGGGTGLGLTLARAIVEAHHGKIWVEGSRDGGTVFQILLPLS